MRALAAFLLFALPLLAASAPAAQAQVPIVASTLTVTALDPGGNGLPPGGESPVTLVVSYSVAPGGRPAPDPNTDSGFAPTKVRFEIVRAPSWVNATRFEPPVLNLTLTSASGNTAGEAVVLLSVVSDAPARVREELVVRAIADPNGNIQGTSGESAPLKLRARVVTKANVTAAAEGPLFVQGGRWVEIPYVVRNDGNDEMTALLNVTLRPEDSQILLPNRTVVVPRGGSQTVVVGLRMPWTYGSIGTVELEAQPIAEDEVPAARASVDVHARSAAPGPLAGPVLACMALLALARRRSTR